MDEYQQITETRQEFQDAANAETLATSFYMVVNSAQQSEERFKKADEAMKNAETIQDSVNANTMMIMNGNYERLNQIAIQLANLKKQTAEHVVSLPVNGYTKPEPAKNMKLGQGEYSVQEKDEIDVDFE